VPDALLALNDVSGVYQEESVPPTLPDCAWALSARLPLETYTTCQLDRV
jgi:hypothetical protein